MNDTILLFILMITLAAAYIGLLVVRIKFGLLPGKNAVSALPKIKKEIPTMKENKLCRVFSKKDEILIMLNIFIILVFAVSVAYFSYLSCVI